MTKAELAHAITSAIVAGEVIACELGTFFFVDHPATLVRQPRTGEMIPGRAKREARFVPSQELLARVAPNEGLREADYRAYAEQEVVGDVSLTETEVYGDPNDEKLSVHVPEPAKTIVLGALFDQLAAEIPGRRGAAVSGLGRLRLASTRGRRARRRVVLFEASLVLKQVLNPAASSATT